jgi:hypothetical protein
VLQISELSQQTNGHIKLVWTSTGGTRYRVQYGNATALSGGPGAFTELERPLADELDSSLYGADSTQSFTDDFSITGAPTNHPRYYRIRVVR